MNDEIECLAIQLRDKCNRRLNGHSAEAVGIALEHLMIGLLVSLSDNEKDCLEGFDSIAGDIRQGIKSYYNSMALGGKVAGNA